MKKRSFFGMFIILIGILLLLDQLNVVDSDDIFSTYWPVILIVIGLVNLLDKYSSKLFAAILLVAGIIFQLDELDIEVLQYIDASEFIISIIVILIGLWLIIPKTKKRDRNHTMSQDSINSIALFSGSNIINDSNNFGGGNLMAAFGGIDVDLVNANIDSTEPIIIDTLIAFGGIDIKVPRDWKVEVKGIPLFGGWSNKTDRSNSYNKVLLVKCFVMFGGLDIKYEK
ncbi:MAG: cell wall-active antibiotics response protein [Vallitalea sp.]|jgi:hypothetical protein|nr:cell wall-active antibiotics response protein [Vallitalea sp.]